MRTVRLVWRQYRYEQKVFRRTPAAVFFVVAFPVVLLVIFASLNRHQHLSQLGGTGFTQYYTPSMAAFALMSACYANLAGRFVYRRETGVLKRFRTSPLPLSALLSGLLLNAVTIGAVVAIVNLTAGALLYGMAIPHRWLDFTVLLAVASISFCAMAAGISCLIPNLDSSDPIIWGTFMPLVFISGAFFPIPHTATLSRIAAVFPIQHLVQAAYSTFNPHSGQGVAFGDLLIIAAWGVAGTALALSRFRWEPRRS